jgi:excisionase family DNA binding protein
MCHDNDCRLDASGRAGWPIVSTPLALRNAASTENPHAAAIARSSPRDGSAPASTARSRRPQTPVRRTATGRDGTSLSRRNRSSAPRACRRRREWLRDDQRRGVATRVVSASSRPALVPRMRATRYRSHGAGSSRSASQRDSVEFGRPRRRARPRWVQPRARRSAAKRSPSVGRAAPSAQLDSATACVAEPARSRDWSMTGIGSRLAPRLRADRSMRSIRSLIACRLDVATPHDRARLMEARDWLTPPEVAARLRVSPQTVTRWIREGKLIAVRIQVGKRPFYRVPLSSYRAFLLAFVHGE